MFWRQKRKTDLFKSLNLVDVDLKPRLVIKSGHYILPSNLYRLTYFHSFHLWPEKESNHYTLVAFLHHCFLTNSPWRAWPTKWVKPISGKNFKTSFLLPFPFSSKPPIMYTSFWCCTIQWPDTANGRLMPGSTVPFKWIFSVVSSLVLFSSMPPVTHR